MSDILKVTTPNTVYENAQRPNNVTVNDPVIQNIADPTKVTRPTGRRPQTNRIWALITNPILKDLFRF